MPARRNLGRHSSTCGPAAACKTLASMLCRGWSHADAGLDLEALRLAYGR